MTTSPIDPRELRTALGAFVTGVTVVTTLDAEGHPLGFTANSFTSVSLDPPLVLVCMGKRSSSRESFSTVGRFAVNILAEEQKNISSTFASKVADRFADLDWRTAKTGSPIIADVVTWLDCELHDLIDAGDHMILIGRVVAFDHITASPLGYCRGNYLSFSLEQEALTVSKSGKAQVGAILEVGGRILFVETATGGLALPTGTSLDAVGDRSSFKTVLSKLGVDADIGFLFAVFEDEKSKLQSIYYRGEISGLSVIKGETRLIRFNEIPWDAIQDEAVSSMLRRYVTERMENRFGVYVGGIEQGAVQALA